MDSNEQRILNLQLIHAALLMDGYKFIGNDSGYDCEPFMESTLIPLIKHVGTFTMIFDGSGLTCIQEAFDQDMEDGPQYTTLSL